MPATDEHMTPDSGLRASFHTLGCRLNQAETASISATFANKGYQIVDYGADTDICVINTCSVTESAEAKCRQAVRAVLRRSPKAYVVVTGCYAQVGKDALRGIDGLDLIVGTAHKMQVVNLIDTTQKEVEPRVVHTTKIDRDDFALNVIGDYSNHTRANLKIQDGCNFACAFCIIPFSRGGARSRQLADILSEARGLVARGHREIVLTGVNIGTYASDGQDLLKVIQALEEIDGLERLRISSIEPTTIPDALIDWMASSTKLCPYLHVPLQSGDDGVLQRMKRRYTRGEFAAFIERVAERVPGVCLGSDAMVGFPGEDEEAFSNTRLLLADLPFAYCHVFSYSERPHTFARRYAEQVPPAEIQARSRTLRELSARKKTAFYRDHVGSTMRVLFERRENSGLYTGFSDNYLKVGVEALEDLSNTMTTVRLEDVRNGLMTGEVVRGSNGECGTSCGTP